MVRQCELHLVSKLRYHDPGGRDKGDAALYFPYDGPYSGHGPRKKYGDKVDYYNLPQKYLLETHTDGALETRIYQAELLHRDFAQPLNVVSITKTNSNTRAFANVNLFSSDLELSASALIDYYGLRFQIG